MYKTENIYKEFGTFSLESKIFYIILKDLIVFSEKKMNLGLFSLKSKLNIKLYCKGTDFCSTQILLKNLKLLD
jgi:hypothetical protein